MRSSGFESTVGVRDRAASVIVEVGFDVTAHNTAEGPDQVVDLSWAGASNSIRDTDAVDADLVNCAIDRQQVDQVGSERIFRRESNLLALALDELNNLNGSVLDIGHILAVRVLPEVARGSDDDIEAVYTGFDRDLSIFEVTPYVREDLSLEAKFADSLAVEAGLLACGGASELDV